MMNRRGDSFFEGLGRDLRYALRSLRREPVFTAGVVLTFALAIGVNASMFGLVARLMLAPPPGIRDAERVARVRLSFFEEDGNSFVASTTSYPTFRALREQRPAFAMVGAAKPDTIMVGRTPNVSPIAALGVSHDYLGTLGATPALGRFFGPGDDEPPTGSSVIVLGHAYWQRAFGGDAAVLGQSMVIDDQPFTIVGVAARGFNGAELGAVDAFLPLSASLRSAGGDWVTNPFMNLVSVVARLADGVPPARARQIASAGLRQETERTRRMSAAVELVPMTPGAESRRSPQSRIALWLAGVSVVVLLIATANVGTLLSLRSARRRREIAVRVAMGAGHGHLARQLLVESLLLAIIGAAAGLLLSRWFSQLLRATLLPALAPSEGVVDRRVLVSSLLASCVAGVLAGLVPLVQARRTNVSSDLRAGGHGISGRLAFQNLLVRVQVALCAVLLVGAALFVRSLQRVQSQDLGFSTTSLLHTQLDFRGYVSGPERDLAYDDAVRRLRSVNAVTGVTVVAGVPFGPHYIPPVSVPGKTWPPGKQIPIMYAATPEYLDIMNVRVVEGRLLAARDGPGAPPVVLVNESMARTVWPGESALGKCVRVGFGTFPPTDEGNPSASAPCRAVVGVVRDSRARSIRPDGSEDHLMQYYVSFDQMPLPPRPDPSRVMGLMVRVRGDADRAVGLVQGAIQSTSAVPVFARTRPYQDFLDPQLRSWRLGATLFSTFSVLALGIAAVGLFGVVSYVVTQRTQEIGVRLALGGTSTRVASLIIRDALSTVSIGVAMGLLGAIVAGPFVESMLFQTSPREPASLATAAAVLLAATVVAAALPAWRAGRVDPVRALRAE